MNKKYYWLKLNENFFDREEIKVIEAMSNGEVYINFYLKLLLKSIKSEGSLKFRGVMPYSDSMLASITNTNVDTVRVAIDMFIQLGLMEKLDDGSLFMLETLNMIGSETDSALRMRKARQKNKQKELVSQCDGNVTEGDKEGNKSDIETETETKTDLDIYTDLDIQQQIDKVKKLLSVSDKEAKVILKESKYSFDVVVSKWNIIKNQKLRNKVGALLTAIKEDWSSSKNVQGTFNNFEQREYDFDSLERKLLGWEE